MTIPSQTKQIMSMSNVTPDFGVKTPLKYTCLGFTNLNKSTTATIYRLENGQKVVIIPKEGQTFVKTYVNTGSMNEPDDKRGISHFIEHNLFNGSDGNNGEKGLGAGEFFKTVDKMGADTNASTSFAQTDYYVATNQLKKDDLAKAIKIHAQMLENPTFAVNMIEKEKGPVTSEISMILDNPGNLATNNTIKNLYGIKSKSADMIGGTVDNINKLTRDDVVNYYRQNYYPEDMVTVVTGEVNPSDVIKLIAKEFQSKKAPTSNRKYENLQPISKTVRNDIISDKATSAMVSIGFNGPQNNNSKDKILLDAIQYMLLGSSVSRLDKPLEMVESSALVSTERISNRPTDSRVILLETQTGDERSEKVLKTIVAGINDLIKNPPSEEDLAIIKKDLKLYAASLFEDTEGVNSVVGEAMLDNDLESISKYNQAVDNMTPEDISNFAKKYLDLNKASITVVHPKDATEKNIKSNYKKSNISFTGSLKDDNINKKSAIDLSKVKQYEITNNIKFGTYDTNNELASFGLIIDTKAPANVKPGTAEILSDMLNAGSGEKDENTFFKDLEKQGISVNFKSSDKGIYVESSFLPQDAKLAMKSTKEVLLNPRFTEEDFEQTKNNIKASLQNSQKSADEGLMKGIFGYTHLGYTTKDILNSLDSVTLADVKGLYAYIMENGQAKSSLAAPISENQQVAQDVMEGLSTDFQTFKPFDASLFQLYKPIEKPQLVIQDSNRSQAEIEMGYKFRTNGNLKDERAVSILNIILGGTPSSRLFSDLREKQKLAYQVCSRLKMRANTGVLMMYIKTTTDDKSSGVVKYDNLQKSIEGFNSHAKKLMNEDVTDEELENAKLHLKNSVLKATQATEGKKRAVLSGLSSPYGVSARNQELEVIDSITKDDIKACANYIFTTKPVTSIVATQNTIDNNQQIGRAHV